MYVNPLNVHVPIQAPYRFSDGELHSDPNDLNYYLGAERIPKDRTRASSLERCFDKARRVKRLAANGNKERSRRLAKGRGE